MSSATPAAGSTEDQHSVSAVPLRLAGDRYAETARRVDAPPAIADEVVCRDLDQLTHDEWQAWNELRRQDDRYAQPFFSPEFSRAVHAVRGDVRVAVLRQHCDVIGLLPYHRIGRVGYPVGRFFNDAHNILQTSGASLNWMDVLAGLSLRSFDAHALVGGEQNLVESCGLRTVGAFASALGDDSRQYLRRLESQHVTIKRQPQKTRKLAREVGEVRLEIDCRCPDVLSHVVRWKRDQYARTHILDLFSPKWTRDLVFQLFNQQRDSGCYRDARLSGLCSVLWAGGKPVAAHFGMIERGRLHYWFPAYDPAYARYSPGTALFRHMVAAASDHGIHTIDMGYGEQPYKQKQTDVVSNVAAGCISRCKVHSTVRWIQKTALAFAHQAPMKERAKRIVRTLRPNAGISKLG